MSLAYPLAVSCPHMSSHLFFQRSIIHTISIFQYSIIHTILHLSQAPPCDYRTHFPVDPFLEDDYVILGDSLDMIPRSFITAIRNHLFHIRRDLIKLRIGALASLSLDNAATWSPDPDVAPSDYPISSWELSCT